MINKLNRSQLLFFSAVSFNFSLLASLLTSVSALPVINADINFAGAGGDFSSRTATFIVPESTTVIPVENYGLRLYEAHLGKMIEVTFSFCQDRESDYIVHWNYEAAKYLWVNFLYPVNLPVKLDKNLVLLLRKKLRFTIGEIPKLSKFLV